MFNNQNIVFGGDFFPSEGYVVNSCFKIDILVLNYESAPAWISPKSPENYYEGKVNLISKNNNIQGLRDCSSNVHLSVANNHFFDSGMFKEVFKNNVFFGYKTTSNDSSYISYDFLGKSINIYAFVESDTNYISSSGIKFNNVDTFESNLDTSEYNVAYIHWGEEEINIPTPDCIRKAKRLVELGFKLIIGHHAHVQQSVCHYKESVIFFGLGNFAFRDLNEPSYFKNSISQRKYYKKQTCKHKNSLVVEITNSLEINVYKARYNNNIIDISPTKVNIKALESCEEIFKRQIGAKLKRRSRLAMYKNFLRNPKLPSTNKIKKLIKGTYSD